MNKSEFKLKLEKVIELYKVECTQRIEKANQEIEIAQEYKKKNPLDWKWTNVMGEPGDGDAMITNAQLNIQLAEETISLGDELNHAVNLHYNTENPREIVIHDLHKELKRHLTELESAYNEIPKPSKFLGNVLNTRGNDLIDIKRFWTKAKMNMVISLLNVLPANVEFGIELQQIGTGGRRCKRTGRKRTGVSGKKRGRRRTNKKRKSITRRRLRRRH
jgi:hypothetical protein